MRRKILLLQRERTPDCAACPGVAPRRRGPSTHTHAERERSSATKGGINTDPPACDPEQRPGPRLSPHSSRARLASWLPRRPGGAPLPPGASARLLGSGSPACLQNRASSALAARSPGSVSVQKISAIWGRGTHSSRLPVRDLSPKGSCADAGTSQREDLRARWSAGSLLAKKDAVVVGCILFSFRDGHLLIFSQGPHESPPPTSRLWSDFCNSAISFGHFIQLTHEQVRTEQFISKALPP